MVLVVQRQVLHILQQEEGGAWRLVLLQEEVFAVCPGERVGSGRSEAGGRRELSRGLMQGLDGAQGASWRLGHGW